MINTFLATINPMLTLFICIVLGFILSKLKLLPENASKVMAKLETYAFCPALSFYTMARNCTVKNIGEHGINIILFSVVCAVAILISYLLNGFFVKDKKSYDRGVFLYALAFANIGYVGDPLVLSMFGEVGLSYYKLACLPLSMLIYIWGISVLVPKKEGSGKFSALKNVLNPPTIALFIGIAVGLLGLGETLLGSEKELTVIGSTLNNLKNCMGPVAMIIAGCTVAQYKIKPMLTNKKVYFATILRLILIPTLLVPMVFGLKTLMNACFNLTIDNFIVHLAFVALGAPLGLNTVVFPEAYGGDAKTGAGMAMISHTLCVITIPLMYALVSVIFPL
ncbi:MAG: AEC family transporter [Clostridia bacterium]|nr:AEC family transporter [Clostridia bacterium]